MKPTIKLQRFVKVLEAINGGKPIAPPTGKWDAESIATVAGALQSVAGMAETGGEMVLTERLKASRDMMANAQLFVKELNLQLARGEW